MEVWYKTAMLLADLRSRVEQHRGQGAGRREVRGEESKGQVEGWAIEDRVCRVGWAGESGQEVTQNGLFCMRCNVQRGA